MELGVCASKLTKPGSHIPYATRVFFFFTDKTCPGCSLCRSIW